MLTTSGWQAITRRRLVATDDEGHPDSAERCAELLGTTSVYPLDMYLGIDNLPFKATADEALRIARAGATSPSYRDAARLLEEDHGVRLSDVLVREVTEYVGEIVLWEDRRLAELAVAAHDPSVIRSSKRGRRPKDGYTLFAEADGAMLNELQDEGGTAWKEGKLGVVFRSDELVESGTDANGAPKRRIGRREYVCTTEGADVLRARMLRAMRDNGLGDASFVVVIGDGAKWIRRMRDELVPKGKLVLDLYHLKENAMEFAQHVHGGDRSLYYPWWKSVCAELEAGDWRKVLASPCTTHGGSRCAQSSRPATGARCWQGPRSPSTGRGTPPTTCATSTGTSGPTGTRSTTRRTGSAAGSSAAGPSRAATRP